MLSRRNNIVIDGMSISKKITLRNESPCSELSVDVNRLMNNGELWKYEKNEKVISWCDWIHPLSYIFTPSVSLIFLHLIWSTSSHSKLYFKMRTKKCKTCCTFSWSLRPNKSMGIVDFKFKPLKIKIIWWKGWDVGLNSPPWAV